MLETFAGRFLLLRSLGKGGMGEVFLARDLTTGQECALKRLSAAAAARVPDGARREYELLSRIRHPLLVQVYEFGVSPEGVPFCTMEYVPGVSADRAVPRGDWATLCYVGSQIALGLEFLHSVQVAHGDVKPANVLVIPADVAGERPRSVRLLDFGLAGVFEEAAGGHTGTPGFAAPEVVRGESLSAATDLYGLGVTLYALACGRLPFEGDDQDSMLRRQQAGPPSALPLEQAGAPSGLIELILKLMAPETRERPASAREVSVALGRLHPGARRTLSERLQATTVVGRERELSRIEKWLATTTGNKRLTVLTGEAGSGKSSLLAEIAARSALEGPRSREIEREGPATSAMGIDCVHLSCGAHEGRGELIRVLLRRMASAARIDLAEVLAPPLDRLARSDVAIGDHDLDALVEAGVRCIGSQAEKSRKLVVLLDDAERLDPLSGAWLGRMLCHPQAGSLRTIWARRTGAGADEIEGAMRGAGFAETIALGALERDAVERLAAARLGDVPGNVLVEFLWSRGGGHPGFSLELLKAAAAQGAIVDDGDGLRVSPEALGALALPSDFEDSLERRLDELSAGARSLLEGLAVWERPLGPAGLRHIIDNVQPDDVETVLDTGLARRLPDGELLIWPPAFSARVVASMPTPRVQEIHRRALEIDDLGPADRFRHLRGLEKVDDALSAADEALALAPDMELAQSAATLAQTAAASTAARWSERVARLWIERKRFAAAIPHLEKSLELEPSDPARGPRWAALVMCLLRSGRFSEMVTARERALTGVLGERDRLSIEASDAARRSTIGEISEAQQKARQVLNSARTQGVDDIAAVCAEILSRTLLFERKTDEAEPYATEAGQLYKRVDDVVGQVRSLITASVIARARNDLEAAEQLGREALRVARNRGNRLAIEEALVDLALPLSFRGKWVEARECYIEALRVAVEDGRSGAGTIANLGYMAGLLGDSREAITFARRAMRLVKAHRPRILGFNWRSLAQARRITGQYRAAIRAAHRAITLVDRAMPEDRIWARLELGRAYAHSGKWSTAAGIWRSIAEKPGPASPPENIIVRAHLVRASLRDGNGGDQAAELSALEAWAAQHKAPHAEAHVFLARAELALQRGTPAGEDLATRALQAFTSLGAVPERAMAALDLVRTLPVTSGNAPTAMRWLRTALQDFERLRNLQGRLQTLSLMLEWQKRAPASGAPSTTHLGLIERVSWLLNSITDLSELAHRALRMAIEQLDAERGAILLLDRETGQFRVIAEQGAMDATARNEALGFSRRVVERVTESGGALLISDAASDPRVRSDSIMNLQLLSILCVPLFSGSTVMGAVYLDDSRRAHRFADEDRGLLEGVAHLMAVAIDKARGHEETERSRKMLEEENLELRQEVGARFQYQNVIGTSSLMKRVLATVAHAARTNTTVLISGENGTGKELIARTLHHTGRQKAGPFRSVNCGAITESLLESELFGIMPNVATGVRERKGLFVQANGGTLFLDEIGEMPLRQQVALLSALANREITPVGGYKPIPFDVRIIAATNKNLRRLVAEGLFREDLYYRLGVIEVEVPPLRDRKSDLPALAMHFIRYFSKAQEREVPELSPDFMAMLMQSDWPGNVRELQNYIERVLAVNPGGVLRPDPLPPDLQNRGMAHRSGRARRLADTVSDIERRMLLDALQKAGGNQSEAARILGLTEQSIRYRIRKYGMGPARAIRRTRRN